MLAAAYRAVRSALDGVGWTESPRAQGGGVPHTLQRDGYRITLPRIVDSGELRNRDAQGVELQLVVELFHQLRPTADDSHADLEALLVDVEQAVAAILGDAEVALHGRSPTWLDADLRLGADGHTHTTSLRFRLVGEFAFTLDG